MIRSQAIVGSKGGYPDKKGPAKVSVESNMSKEHMGGEKNAGDALFKSLGKGIEMRQMEGGHKWSHGKTAKPHPYRPGGEFGTIKGGGAKGTHYTPTYSRPGKNALGSYLNRKGQNAVGSYANRKGSNAVGTPPNRKGSNAVGTYLNRRGDNGLATALKGGRGTFKGKP